MFKNISVATQLLFVLILLNLLDFGTTYYALQIGGVENNPIMNHLMEYTGTVWSLLWIKVVVLNVAILPYYVIESKKNVWKSKRMIGMLMGLNALFLYVVVSNSFKLSELLSIQS